MAQRFVPGTDQRTTVPWTASMVGAVLAGGWVAARTGPAATDKAPKAAAREHPFKAIMRFTSSGMGEPHGSCGYPSLERATRMPVVGKQDGSSVGTGGGKAPTAVIQEERWSLRNMRACGTCVAASERRYLEMRSTPRCCSE